MLYHLDLAGAFDEPTAMFYAGNVLLALEHLHSRGLVYRDLKPENLLFDAQGYCKIADFGFAKKIGADKTYTICGTPDYQVTYCYGQTCHLRTCGSSCLLRQQAELHIQSYCYSLLTNFTSCSMLSKTRV